MSRITSLVIMILLVVSFVSYAETINVQIKGIDDGEKTTRQQDYKEAVLFAKREAIERAGVQIKSETKVKDLMLYEDFIESKAEAVLLSGYNIIDVGYTEDGTYQVVLVGKVVVAEPPSRLEDYISSSGSVSSVGRAHVSRQYIRTPKARPMTISAATSKAKANLLQKLRQLRLPNSSQAVDAINKSNWQRIEQVVDKESIVTNTQYLSDGSIEVTLTLPKYVVDEVIEIMESEQRDR